MKKISLLLLITLIRGQSNGVRLTGSNHPKKLDDIKGFQLEDWDNSDSSSAPALNKLFDEKFNTYEKRLGSDVLARRSILDKTFMRFGRNNEENCHQKGCRIVRSSLYKPEYDDQYSRDDRALKDNFIRFGRGARDNFIRFGRGMRDNFIRFGRDGGTLYQGEEFPAEIKRLQDSGFIRFGRNDFGGFARFGKLDQNFIRFGRRNSKTFAGNDDDNKSDKPRDFFGEYRTGARNFETEFRADDDLNGFSKLLKDGGLERGTLNDKNMDFEEDHKNTNPDMVIRMKRKADMYDGEKNDPGKNTINKIDTAMEENSTESKGNSPSFRYKVFNRRSTGHFPDLIPGFFPQDYPPRIQYYAKTWNNLKNHKNYDYYAAPNPPYFPVFTNF